MSIYSDDADVNVQIADLESVIERFIELFDDIDGQPALIAEEDEITDILNDAAIVLERTYEGVD